MKKIFADALRSRKLAAEDEPKIERYTSWRRKLNASTTPRCRLHNSLYRLSLFYVAPSHVPAYHIQNLTHSHNVPSFSFTLHTNVSLSRSFTVSIRWTTRERFLQWINVKLFHLSKATHLVKRSSCSEVHIFMGILSFFPSRNVQYSRNRLALFPFHSLVQARVSLLFARSSACIKVCTH